ncbi:MAG: hypothetical protein ACOYL5_19790, partial [Phototrophicaceae bacterium]
MVQKIVTVVLLLLGTMITTYPVQAYQITDTCNSVILANQDGSTDYINCLLDLVDFSGSTIYVALGMAYEYETESNRTAAIDRFSELIDENPDLGILYSERGFAYRAEQEYELAKNDIARALELNPDIYTVYLELLSSIDIDADTLT